MRIAGDLRRGEWPYVILTIAAFVFVPEVRRIADWRGAYDPLNAFAIIPLLMLCPIGVIAYLRRTNIASSAYSILAMVWVGGFLYSLLVSIARGATSSGLYAAAQFVLPIVIGFWLFTRPEPAALCYKRLAHSLLICAGLAGFYGIVQYVTAPPWDTAWMQNVGQGSFGSPVPFGIRVFGVLNSPGTYALFLGSVILLNLPFLNPRNVINITMTLLAIIGLTLSLVRSGWIAVIIGIALFFVLSPRRTEPLLAITTIALLCVAAYVCLTVIPNQTFGSTLLDRVNTFTSLNDDSSAADRRQTAVDTLQTALGQPIGAGLGLTGGGSKLQNDISSIAGAPEGVIDNGFVSRFFEMGVVGFTGFIAACAIGFASTLAAYYRFGKNKDTATLQLISGCIVVQFTTFLLNLSGDDQQGLLAVINFTAIAIPLFASTQLDRPLSISTTARGSHLVNGMTFPQKRQH